MKTSDNLHELANGQAVHLNNNNHHQPRMAPFAVDAATLLDETDAPMPFLLPGLLPATGLACVAGSEDAGKTCLLQQLAVAVACGDTTFLGWQLNVQHRSAIYVCTEDGREATRHLLRKQARESSREHLRNLRFVFDDTDLVANLNNELETRPADLVVIDCFEDAYGGDMREAQRIRNFLHRFQLLAERHQCLMLFVHHTAKHNAYLLPEIDNMPGCKGLEAKLRTVLELRADVMYCDRRHLCVLKGNYLPAEAKGESYVLDFDEDTLTYTDTGGRSPFALLALPEPEDTDARDEYYAACRLKAEGYTYQEIAEELGYSAKSSVAAIFKRARFENWDSSYRYDHPDDSPSDEELESGDWKWLKRGESR